jgi:hypothetical protein
MAIRVLCPQGHVLKVRDDLAGKVGRCPVCRSIVRVPGDEPAMFSEDAILGVLATPGPRPRHDPGHNGDHSPGIHSGAEDVHSTPKKSCARCNREIEAGTHICPYCHTYIAGLADVWSFPG